MGIRFDNQPRWMGTRFNLFPLVLDSRGTPWAEAVVFIVSRLENSVNPTMGTYKSIADDLAAFLRFNEESGKDWTVFPRKKLERPTYRYRAHLRLAVTAGQLAASTAKRRMGTVIAFYRWLRKEGTLIPENSPWTESDRLIEFTNSRGLRGSKIVSATDLSMSVPRQEDPYSGLIDDGGKLRPLPHVEQEWVVEALACYGNTELTLIHLLALLTGARIQTALTFRVGHVTSLDVTPGMTEVRLPVGPGTGIDTKNDKQMVLHIPTWFYEQLSVYAQSPRAVRRRENAVGGNTDSQYLFLSARGNPLYRSKADALEYDERNRLRHAKDGQAVRQLITEYLIPTIRRDHHHSFSYRFHDLRATFGMNLTDEQLKKVAAGEITLHEAREFVKTRMGHESAATTDLYLQYRGRLQFTRQVNDQYGTHLQMLVKRACEGATL
jgi:integrase